MARVKLTKNELKRQKDALKRFERYLPTLQLKKQQLQMVIRQVEIELREKGGEREELRAGSPPGSSSSARRWASSASSHRGAQDRYRQHRGCGHPPLPGNRFSRRAPTISTSCRPGWTGRSRR